MKALSLAILILSGIAANAIASQLYATCSGDDVEIIVYSEGKDYGAYVVMVGDNSTFHQRAWEYSHKEKRKFAVDYKNYVSIDTHKKTGVAGIQGTTSTLNCKIDAHAAPPYKRENCYSLPDWFAGAEDDGFLCPAANAWGKSQGLDKFMCCMFPPI